MYRTTQADDGIVLVLSWVLVSRRDYLIKMGSDALCGGIGSFSGPIILCYRRPFLDIKPHQRNENMVVRLIQHPPHPTTTDLGEKRAANLPHRSHRQRRAPQRLEMQWRTKTYDNK
ncbi:hypothetical protein Pcinc_043599 [Petrolisthes cinctipes]|uniref:Uncharacterized protein n=1 Tax=Petrolisthes cinctipes TaxID=88211 RepID=A0AAE1EG42_PETCI|nr:hypothetical protein Pcinc_043599 [Petrolisthes cinctipes]